MSDPRTDLPAPGAPNFNQRLREVIQTYLGRQGNPLDRGLTLRDLVDTGVLKLRAGFQLKPGSGSSIPLEPGDGVVDIYEPDLTPPPTPGNMTVTASISHVMIEHEAPLYRQGHGHLRTRVYGKVVNAGEQLPTFADAAEIGQFSGTVYAHPSNPATTWHFWIKWETVDGVLSPDPAGGTNGLAVTTGQDVSRLLTALTGQITEGQLYQTLQSRINLIDGPSSLTGSVAQRVAQEATNRANAVSAEAATRAQAILDEASARSTADGALQQQINILSAASSGDFSELLAAVQEEQTTRIAADAAEATSRETLATQMRGSYTGTDPSALTTGLVYNERQARVSAEGAISSSVSALSATVTSNNNTLNAAITSEATARANADSALSSTINSVSATANAKNKTYSRASSPASGMVTGDIWFDSDDNNKAYRYSGSAWVETADTRIAANASAIVTEQTARANADTALSSQITTLTSTVNGNTTAIQTEATTRASVDNSLFAQYTVKVDTNGFVSGFGLASQTVGGVPVSDFQIRADRFSITNPSITLVTVSSLTRSTTTATLTTSTAHGLLVGDTFTLRGVGNDTNWNGAYTVLTRPSTTQITFTVASTLTTPATGTMKVGKTAIPFIVDGGVTYMASAMIKDGTITNGKIANLAVDDAKIASLSAGKLTAGSIAVGEYIKSTGYVAGSAGWRIDGNGNAELSNATVRGTVYATNGQFYGTLLGGAATEYSSGAGFYAGSPAAGAYQWRVGNPAGNRIEWDGVNVNIVSPQLTIANGNARFSGDLDAAGGTFSGNLKGATGEFAGTLAAGVLDSAAFDSIRLPYSQSGYFSNQTVPPMKAGWTAMHMRVTVVGAGGGGGGGAAAGAPNRNPTSSGGGGGAGQKNVYVITSGVTPGATFSVSVGSGGSSGSGSNYWNGSSVSGNPGGAGTYSGVTINGQLYSASGGAAGGAGTSALADVWVYSQPDPLYQIGQGGGAGGSIGGQNGTGGFMVSAPGGAGGSSEFGSGGVGGAASYRYAGAGANGGVGAGGGGGGADAAHPDYGYAANGGYGGPGYVMVEFYDPNIVVLNSRYSALVQWLDTVGHGAVPTAAR